MLSVGMLTVITTAHIFIIQASSQLCQVSQVDPFLFGRTREFIQIDPLNIQPLSQPGEAFGINRKIEIIYLSFNLKQH